ncbi:MAG TPA: hypothetical protein VF168_09885 [Trueperaceae bacterium]
MTGARHGAGGERRDDSFAISFGACFQEKAERRLRAWGQEFATVESG